MLYAILGSIVLAAIGLALYALINKIELNAQIINLQTEVYEQAESYSAEIENLKREMIANTSTLEKQLKEKAKESSVMVDGLKREYFAIIDGLNSELSKLENLKHIPNILEKSRKLEAEITAKLSQAQEHADETVLIAHRNAERIKTRITAKLDEAERRARDLRLEASTYAAEVAKRADLDAKNVVKKAADSVYSDTARARELVLEAGGQARSLLEAAELQAREIATRARKEAKEKTGKVDEILIKASVYALEIRERSEARSREIGGQAYEALKRYEFYESAAKAKQNLIEGYADTYIVAPSHLLDELADEYGYHKAGDRLKIARDRSRAMEKNGLAATCNYPKGWKRDYAISFVLSAFNGKVDSILARLKPANQGRLIQEIKDVYALANHNGQVFKEARIHEEYLDARLEELKRAVAVQRLKEKQREEQRAIRDQLRDEEKARKEIEKAIKQAEREQETITKAIERARQEYESAHADDRAKYEAKLQELAKKLGEAEEKNRRAMSMAQQTKRGNVYVISNIGSFGEDVYKIGLTRRLEPMDRVKELGDASVPFSFDVHAMIRSEDAPALEAALHRRFLQNQVNKVNRRKEFFRLKLQDIRNVIDELTPEVRWTMAAEARDYRDSIAMERQLHEDPEFRRQWAESEAAYESSHLFDEDEDETDQEDGDIALIGEAK